MTYEPPVYEAFDYQTAADALAEIKRQHLAGEPLQWTGPDRLHHSISAGCPEPSWHFSPEGLEYHEERDRDFWDIYTMIAFQLGFHNGVLREAKHTERAEARLARAEATADTFRSLLEASREQ